MSNNPVQRGASGDAIPSQVDTVDILDKWVADKKVPSDSIMLSQKDPGPPFTTTSSRPMCRYPMYPRYTGGDKMKGASYTCTLADLGVR
jgi:feruloyl esterase